MLLVTEDNHVPHRRQITYADLSRICLFGHMVERECCNFEARSRCRFLLEIIMLNTNPGKLSSQQNIGSFSIGHKRRINTFSSLKIELIAMYGFQFTQLNKHQTPSVLYQSLIVNTAGSPSSRDNIPDTFIFVVSISGHCANVYGE